MGFCGVLVGWPCQCVFEDLCFSGVSGSSSLVLVEGFGWFESV